MMLTPDQFTYDLQAILDNHPSKVASAIRLRQHNEEVMKMIGKVDASKIPIKSREEIRQLCEAHVSKVRQAALVLGRELNDAAAVGNSNGYFSGYEDAQKEAAQTIEAQAQRIKELEAELAQGEEDTIG